MELRNLTHIWPNREIAIDNVSFKACRSEVTTILGHNGAGKSTLFECLTGSIIPTSGEIRIGNGKEKIGYCPQWNPIFSYMTVEEHLRFYGTLKTGKQISEDEVDEVLKYIDLSYVKDVTTEELSEGIMRNLSVGIAMIGDSQILLLDEPTTGMDPEAKKNLLIY